MPPTLSVVMPSRNRLARLVPLVATYVEQGADQIVIVLDGPHEGWRTALAEVGGQPGVHIEELRDNLGVALARAAGLELATGDIVLIADDDVMPAPGLVDRHRSFHASNPGRALLGYMPVALPARRTRDQSATHIYARDYENQVGEWRRSANADLLDSFWGGNASVPRDLYLEAEALMPTTRLNYNEDLDLGLRLRAIGATASFDELAVGAHLHSRSIAAYRRECWIRGEAVAALELRWDRLPEQLVGLVRIPGETPKLVAAVQRHIARRDSPGLLEGVILAAYAITGALHVWSVQDGLTRLIRRGLAMRGYRMAKSRQIPRPSGPAD